jgi:hypothetical protein
VAYDYLIPLAVLEVKDSLVQQEEEAKDQIGREDHWLLVRFVVKGTSTDFHYFPKKDLLHHHEEA